MTDEFSSEFPNLLQRHLDHLRASAISDDVIRERGYASVTRVSIDREDNEPGHVCLGAYGFAQMQLVAPSLLIPLYGTGGEGVVLHQLRPDTPRTNQSGDTIKYETPGRRSLRVDVPPRCLDALGDPAVPLFVTEGAKKADAIASAGGCCINLMGVWGFKGSNAFGGKTILADFDYIAWNGRLIYLAFDSDIVSKPKVRQALDRFGEIIKRKDAIIKIVYFPPGKDGAKTGADDYLARGHTLEDLVNLAQDPETRAPAPDLVKLYVRKLPYADDYCIHNGRHCFIKHYYDREEREMKEQLVELCDFTARIVDDYLRDDGEPGQAGTRMYKIEGTLSSGTHLLPVDVKATEFMTMNWVVDKWGSDAGLRPGNLMKDHLRAAIETNSPVIRKLVVYTHTGWRVLGNGERVFLTEAGAIGNNTIMVDQDTRLKHYSIAMPDIDAIAAFRGSLEFLDVAPREITLPLWAATYLAPLSEILEPAFMVWLYGASGSGKSTLSALALSHFGAFNTFHLPVSWEITLARLEYALFLAKDVLFVIDDLPPGSDANTQRQMDALVRRVIHNVGNKQGRGRMAGAGVAQRDYYSRGLVMSSGEHLPGGHSDTARYFPVRFFDKCLNLPVLTREQGNTVTYRAAMYYYLVWLRDNWQSITANLRLNFEYYRTKAREEQPNGTHSRLPEAVSNLYLGLLTGLMSAVHYGAIDQAAADSLAVEAWDILIRISAEQATLVESERPAVRFLDALRTLKATQQVLFYDINGTKPDVVPPGQRLIGHTDNMEHPEILYLISAAAYNAVYDYYNRIGQAFFKEAAVWKDMSERGYLIEEKPTPGDKHKSTVRWIEGKSQRVRLLRRELIDEEFLRLGGGGVGG